MYRWYIQNITANTQPITHINFLIHKQPTIDQVIYLLYSYLLYRYLFLDKIIFTICFLVAIYLCKLIIFLSFISFIRFIVKICRNDLLYNVKINAVIMTR